MKASPNPTTVVLFDETSIYHSDTSLVSFMFFQQATIVGQGLLPGDEISFEILRVEPGKMPRVNGACCIAEGKLPTIIGVEPLTCRDCDCDEDFSLVRMTHKNPVVILDAPQGILLRARYTATGGTSNIGNFTVKALIETATRTVPRGMNGCLPKEPPPEYFATMCLPCGGLAFRPEHTDPDATVTLEDCDGTVLGYVYPSPRKGATTEVFEGCGCENEKLIGFAVNDVDKICGGCPEMTVQPMPVPPPPPPPPPPPIEEPPVTPPS